MMGYHTSLSMYHAVLAVHRLRPGLRSSLACHLCRGCACKFSITLRYTV